jgi:hypothetical protein
MSVIAVYCLVCLILLETRNRAVAGGVLQQYYGEYANGGSMKWRFGPDSDSDPRKPLYMFIQTSGLSVYPVAFLGMVISGYSVSRKNIRVVAIATLVICGAVLLRFIYLGVFTAAFGGL